MRMEIWVARCSSATPISPRSHRSPISHNAGTTMCVSISAVVRLASSASRIATSAATSSPISSAAQYARRSASNLASESFSWLAPISLGATIALAPGRD